MRAFWGKSGRCHGTLEISTEALRSPSSNYGPLAQLPMPGDWTYFTCDIDIEVLNLILAARYIANRTTFNNQSVLELYKVIQ